MVIGADVVSGAQVVHGGCANDGTHFATSALELNAVVRRTHKVQGSYEAMRTNILYSVLLVATMATQAVNAQDDAARVVAAEREQSFVVHLSHFTDDLHRAFMALKTADMLVGEKVTVTLYLDLEAVRLAERRQDLEVTWGSSPTTLGELYTRFTEKGGRVLICSHCAHGARVAPMGARPNALIATEDDLRTMWLDADKVIDY